MSHVKFPSLKIAYMAWVILTLITAGHGFMTGEYQSTISLPVDKAGHLLADPTHHQIWSRLVIISLCTVVCLIILVGILVWQTSQRKKWAIWILTIIACWQVYNYTNTLFHIANTYSKIFSMPSWLFDAIGSLLWLYIMFVGGKSIAENRTSK
jgi:hypothetical protein